MGGARLLVILSEAKDLMAIASGKPAEAAMRSFADARDDRGTP